MNRLPLRLGDRPVATSVNLDALIVRDDFTIMREQQQPVTLASDWKATDLTPTSLQYQVLRKPDFQRETANWSAEKITDFLKSFVEGDFIPAVILWRSPDSGNIFVIDGAHRLSALIGWVHDDYGDGQKSREFYSNYIAPEQLKVAEAVRRLIKDSVGSYQEIVSAGLHQDNSPEVYVRRAKNLSVLPIKLQWVVGDAKKAEQSFLKINQQATPIDETELAMIESRTKPNAIAARALLRAGVGHKYWSDFPTETQRKIEELAREVYDTLFVPAIETPIKTLDLPVAGRGYSAESVRLVFEFVNQANGLSSKKQRKDLPAETDGETTLGYLKKVRRLSSRISGVRPESLGLHPAVYFYGATGRYQPAAFLATD